VAVDYNQFKLARPKTVKILIWQLRCSVGYP